MFTDYVLQTQLAAGKINGVKKVNLKGRNSAITTSYETAWSGSSAYAQLTTAVALEVLSASANDAAAGTGARTISIDLIDGNYAASTVTVTLNGVTPVAIAGTFVAINGARVVTAGSGLGAAGTITIRTVSGSTTKAQITATTGLGNNESSEFTYTTPASTISILKSISYSATGVTGDLTTVLFLRDSAGLFKVVAGSKSSLYVTAFNGAMNEVNLGIGIPIPEKTLIEFGALVSAGAGDFVANAELIQITLNSTPGVAGNSFGI